MAYCSDFSPDKPLSPEYECLAANMMAQARAGYGMIRERWTSLVDDLFARIDYLEGRVAHLEGQVAAQALVEERAP